MIGPLRRLWQGAQAHVLWAVFALALLGVAGLGVYVAGWNLWAWHHYKKAEEAIARRRFDEALAHLDLTLSVWPKSGGTHFLAARTARRADKYDKAREHLQKCKDLGWVPEAVKLEAALTHAQRENPATVVGYLAACVEQDHPDSVYILEALTQGYMKNFQHGLALIYVNQWLERAPDDVQALFWRGMIRQRVYRIEEAREDFQRVVDLDPEHDLARLNLAEILLPRKDYRQALDHFEYLHEREPGEPYLVLGIARCKVGLGQLQEARQLLDVVLEAYPRNAAALAERGQLALSAGQTAEAEKWLRQAVAVDRSEPDTVYSLYLCLTQLGKTDEAREWQELYQRLTEDLKRMMDLGQEILKRPADPEPRLQMGLIFLRNGRDIDGLRWLDSALQLAEDHPATHLALADYFERKGRPEQASYHRSKAQGRPVAPGR